MTSCLSAMLLAVTAGVILLSAPTQIHAGPALLPEARPDFQDPLAKFRPVPITADETAAGGDPAAPAGGDNSSFTIIGDTAAGGLEQPEADELTRTVRDEFLGRAAAPENTQPANAPVDAAGGGEASASNLIRALVNTLPGENTGGGGGGGGGNSSSDGEIGLVASVIDATLIDLITTMLNPKFETDGMVTFSIAGFGDFALLLLQETGGMFLVDLESGTAVKFSSGRNAADNRQIARASNNRDNDKRGSSNALQRLLDILERNVLPIVTSPITLATIVLFSMIWIIWRLSARA